MAYHKPKGDIQYYAGKRKRPIAYSTEATLNYLILVQSILPDSTVYERIDFIQNKRNIVFDKEAYEVLLAYVTYGFGNTKPIFRRQYLKSNKYGSDATWTLDIEATLRHSEQDMEEYSKLWRKING